MPPAPPPQTVHGHLELTVSVFGLASNILNVIVLTRPVMTSPTTLLLTALALVELVSLAGAGLHAVMFTIAQPECQGQSEVMFQTWLYMFILTSHTTSIGITVAITIIRYIFVCRQKYQLDGLSMRRTWVIMAASILTSIAICIPFWFFYHAEQTTQVNEELCYEMTFSDTSLTQFSLVFFGLVVKILPCVIITCFSLPLIRHVKTAKRHHASMFTHTHTSEQHQHKNNTNTSTISVQAQHQHKHNTNTSTKSVQAQHQHKHNTSKVSSLHNHHTTGMLLVMVITSVVTEAPNGVMAFIGGFSFTFAMNVYDKLGEILDLLALVNMTINFIIYCAMSKRFRTTFRDLFTYRLVLPSTNVLANVADVAARRPSMWQIK